MVSSSIKPKPNQKIAFKIRMTWALRFRVERYVMALQKIGIEKSLTGCFIEAINEGLNILEKRLTKE